MLFFLFPIWVPLLLVGPPTLVSILLPESRFAQSWRAFINKHNDAEKAKKRKG